MTCEEFRLVIHNFDPAEIPDALGAAMCIHQQQCADCQEWVAVLSSKTNRHMPEAEVAECRQLAKNFWKAATGTEAPAE